MTPSLLVTAAETQAATIKIVSHKAYDYFNLMIPYFNCWPHFAFTLGSFITHDIFDW